ncbi:MAG: hypothetical protein Q7N50_10150 [Armatimonadota bacterium]|nr:hypothetical protein [Armatimonadota bacterium]
MDITGKTDRDAGETGVTAVSPTHITNDISNCKFIAESLRQSGLWSIPGQAKDRERGWRVSPEPLELSADCVKFLERLGPALYSFYNAANTLYLRGHYSWVNDYLDRGKPQSLIEYGHMNFQRRKLPMIIRPDIILGEDTDYITELDSVPGGIGLTGSLSILYGQLGFELIGGRKGLPEGFAQAMQSTLDQERSPALAVVVSEESKDYRSEMEWLAGELRELGWIVFTIRPEEVIFTEDGLFVREVDEANRIDVLYRFFELFDLKNIPKAELVMYAAKKKRVVVTPPYKAYLEEKSLLALFHHPMLQDYWREQMGNEAFDLLAGVIPKTWILDSRPAPPHVMIPDFQFRGKRVNDWRVIKEGTQKERRLVIKPSGFSPLAWGSRGVVVGHDVSQEEWAAAVENALGSFQTLPYVLQQFHEGKRVKVRYYEERDVEIREMTGRVRLSPYYFVSGGTAKLGGVLATICPLDKKLIHGMVDAVMVPCSAGK